VQYIWKQIYGKQLKHDELEDLYASITRENVLSVTPETLINYAELESIILLKLIQLKVLHPFNHQLSQCDSKNTIGNLQLKLLNVSGLNAISLLPEHIKSNNKDAINRRATLTKRHSFRIIESFTGKAETNSANETGNKKAGNNASNVPVRGIRKSLSYTNLVESISTVMTQPVAADKSISGRLLNVEEMKRYSNLIDNILIMLITMMIHLLLE
jgi:ribosomal protein S15P/S13E